MSEKTDTTAPADDMADDTETTDEDQIWKELAAEDGAAAPEDDGAADNEAPDDDPGEEEAGKAADDPEDTDQGDDDGEEETGGEDNLPDDDAQTPTMDELRKRSEEMEQKFRSEQSRSIAQQKRADRLQKELEALKRRQPTEDETDEDREERLNAVAEEYGDVVNPLLDEIRDLRGRFNALSEQDKQRLETIEGELDDIQSAEVAKFNEEHPDGMDVIAQNAEVFRDWIEDQPKFVRDAYQVNLNQFVDGTGAAMVVSRFKAALGEAAAGEETETDTRLERRRRRQLDGAKSTRPTSPQKAAGDIPPDTDDEEAHWEYWRRKDAQG